MVTWLYAVAPPHLTVRVPLPGVPAPLFAGVPGDRSCPPCGHRLRLYTSRLRAPSLSLLPGTSSRAPWEVPGLCGPCLSPVGCLRERDAGRRGNFPHSFLFPDATGSPRAATAARRRVPAGPDCSFSSPLPHLLRPATL